MRLLVVQWIEQLRPKGLMGVRFPPRRQSFKKNHCVLWFHWTRATFLIGGNYANPRRFSGRACLEGSRVHRELRTRCLCTRQPFPAVSCVPHRGLSRRTQVWIRISAFSRRKLFSAGRGVSGRLLLAYDR